MTAPFTFSPPGRLIDFMREAGEPGLINLAAGVPGTDSLPAQQLSEAITRGYAADGAAMFAYHFPDGDPRLRALLAERLRQRGTNVRAAQVLTVTGCQQGLQLMLDVLAQPGDVVACEVPTYYALLELIAVRGCRILPVPVRGPESVDLAEVDALLARWKPKCFFICTTLSNPTGATIPEASRPKLVEICRKHGVRIVEDDIYAKLVEGGAPPPLRAFDDGSTVSFVSSFSKSVSPGLRVGVCVPGTIYERVAERKVQQDMHSCVISETALRCFLEAGAIEPHLTTLRDRNRTRRALALAAIDRAFPAGTKAWSQRGGYMVWAELPGLFDLAKARDLARKEHVVFAAGSVFFPAPTDRSYLRLNCAKASEADLVRGLEILGGVLRTCLRRLEDGAT
jgi:2-aminoadipate transaminase